MSIDSDISTHRGTVIQGGTDIPRSAVYDLIVRWGRALGLPDDEAYRRRLDAAYPRSGRGRPGGMSVKRLRLAETARCLHAASWTEGTIAIVLLWNGEEPSLQTLKNVTARRKRNERDLQALEAAEGRNTRPLRRHENTGPRRAAAEAVRRREQDAEAVRDEVDRCLREAAGRGRSADPVVRDDPACAAAYAKHLRSTVEARRSLDRAGIPRVRGPRDDVEQEELLKLADREDRYARMAALDRRAAQRTPSEVATMRRSELEELVDGLGLEPLIEPDAWQPTADVATADAQEARRSQLGGGRRRPRAGLRHSVWG